MRRRLRHGRQKALFGAAEASAILGAAAITSAATLKGAQIARDATIQGARDESIKIKENADKQAEALAKQDENNKKLNENIVNTTKEIAEQQKRYQQDIQMNMALMAGKENMDNRLEMSKMFAKRGGRLGEHMNNKHSLLRGGNNIGFKLPRRGSVELVGVTPEGYNLYSIYGPSHKSGGVDIDFENGGKIEAEGDAAKTGRNKRNKELGGEYMLTTPNDAFFISQHDINGFNPAEAVDNGMHPLQAFNIQEYNKELIGTNDDGTRRAMNGTQLINAGLNSIGNPNFLNTDDGAVIISAMNKRRLRNGGRIKYAKGGFWNNGGTNLVGAGISSLGNLGATLLGNSGARERARILGDAYGYAGQTLSDAYNKLQTIDDSIISSDDFKAAHYIPIIRAARVNVNPKLAAVDRTLESARTRITNNSLSSAAMNNRLNKIETAANDQRMSIYADKENREEEITQKNIEEINKAAAFNAAADNEANQNRAENRFRLARYNNDILNQRILGSAGSLANANISSANAQADAKSTIGNNWGNFASNIGQQAANVLSAYAQDRRTFETDLAKSSGEESVKLVIANGTTRDAQNLYDVYKARTEDPNATPAQISEAQRYMKVLKDNFNRIKSYGAAKLGGSANRITLKNVKYYG